jgi:hypothetical protein
VTVSTDVTPGSASSGITLSSSSHDGGRMSRMILLSLDAERRNGALFCRRL